VKMGPIRCPETSVNNYHTMARNIPEQRISIACTSECDIKAAGSSETLAPFYQTEQPVSQRTLILTADTCSIKYRSFTTNSFHCFGMHNTCFRCYLLRLGRNVQISRKYIREKYALLIHTACSNSLRTFIWDILL
jgi:hypothetical protein